VETSNTRYYTANVHCKNITALGKNDGKLDLTKTQQSFLYAWGPTDKSLSTTEKTAGIRRHEAYGTFWMDMTRAASANANDGAVPSGSALSTTTNAGADGGAKSDGDKMGSAHAVLMCGAFALIFPLGAVLLRLLENVKMHGIVQGVGALVVLGGSGAGIYLGNMYNHVSHSAVLTYHGQHLLKYTLNRPNPCHPATNYSVLSYSVSSSSNSVLASTTISGTASSRGPPCMERYIYTLALLLS